MEKELSVLPGKLEENLSYLLLVEASEIVLKNKCPRLLGWQKFLILLLVETSEFRNCKKFFSLLLVETGVKIFGTWLVKLCCFLLIETSAIVLKIPALFY